MSESNKEGKATLTADQKARIERNRQKALSIRKSKAAERKENFQIGSSAKVCRVIDTGGGFFIDEEDEAGDLDRYGAVVLKHPAAPLVNPNDLICQECEVPFIDSFLFSKFQLDVCDMCKQNKEGYNLISKSTAKSQYLLNDTDLEKREPVLNYILKKNPRDSRWGDMRLYLEAQVAQRALEIWGSEEALEKERESRIKRRDSAKEKKYEKNLNNLRKQIRSTLFKKEKEEHVHEFQEEIYNEESDLYTKICTLCGHTMEYEKM